VSMPLYHPDGRTQRIRVFDQPADINAMFYDVRMLHGVDVVMTSGAARGRFEADTVRFGVQWRFYRFLDREATHVARFRAERGVSGPNVDIFQINARAREAIVRRGSIHALWWAEYVPPSFRQEFEELTQELRDRSGGALLLPDGMIAPWIAGLQPFFDRDVRPFTRLLSWELSRFGRYTAAMPLLQAVHIMHPEETDACIAYAQCAALLAAWPEIDAATAITLAAAGDKPVPADLRYLRGVALARLGRNADALRELELAYTLAPAGSDLRGAAGAEARALGPVRR
jgi:hypothetical protein